MSEILKIECLKDNNKEISLIEIWENDSNVKICFKLDDIAIFKIGENFFDTLIETRKILELKGICLLCKGCSKNVYPSAMLLNMGAGRNAYILKLGEQAKMSSLVDIFSSCNPEEYATIEEQHAFFKMWTESLRR